MEERYIAAVDLGSSKIALTVAKIYAEDVQVLYYKETPSDGIRYSSVYAPMKVEKQLKEAIAQAESELKIKILQVVVGMPRYAVQVETATGRVDRDGGSCIEQEEIDNLKSMALMSYPLNDPKREIMYGAVAQSFSTEDEFQQTESDVVGMVSDFLEGNFKTFIGLKRPVSNIDMVMNDLDLAIAKKYFIPDVTAKAVLTNEEMVNGVALIDFGAGVTSVSVYQNKIMRHYASIPFGGKSITGDIRIESNISEELAENIKLAFGALNPNKLQTLSEKVIQINDENDVPLKQIPVKYLSEIMTDRTIEIIEAVLYEIQKSGYADNLRAGVVITGGCANMTGLSSLVKDMSGYNVRLGFPRHLFSAIGCNGVAETTATTAIGMILASKHDKLNCVIPPEPEPVFIPEDEPEMPVEEPVSEPEPQTVIEPINAEPAETGFMPAPEPVVEETAEEEPEVEPAPASRSAAPAMDDMFSFDGPNPYPSAPKAEPEKLFSDEDTVVMPKKTPKPEKPKKPAKPDGRLITWFKKATTKIEDKMGSLYDGIE